MPTENLSLEKKVYNTSAAGSLLFKCSTPKMYIQLPGNVRCDSKGVSLECILDLKPNEAWFHKY